MKFNTGSCVTFSTMVQLLGLAASAAPACGACRTDIDTPEYYEKMANNYVNLWGGDYSLLNSTLSPTMSFHSDSFPSGDGLVALSFTTADEFLGFIERVRTGWETYTIKVYKSAASDYNVFIRWRLEAVIGADFPPELSTTLKEGDKFTYNGTDSLVLNQCTGLADEVDSAQDSLNFFKALGWTTLVL